MSNNLPRLENYDESTIPRKVEKPWGSENWLELWGDLETGRGYCLKIISLNQNQKSSLQYHKVKVETQYILSGRAELTLENEQGTMEKRLLNEGDFFTVAPNRKHRVHALTDLTLLEVSTPEIKDVVRVDDDYGRKD